MLNESGFKGTFFVIPGRVSETVEDAEKRKDDKRAWGTITWDELKEMARQGHEIANHTWTHPNLTGLTPAEVVEQIVKAKDGIREHIGAAPLTLAFPFNASTPEIQAEALKQHVAYRAYQKGAGGKDTVESLNAWADKQVKEGTWGVLMTHGIATGYAAFTDPEIFREHLNYVKGRDKEIWVDTFANVARYEKEREDAKLSVSSAVSGKVVCVLAGSLDSAVYDVPLTLVIEASGASSARAERSGQDLPVRVGNDKLQMDVIPGAGTINITWQ
jgi:peptidoglycan/xylan/chitin deacetylase (PgdA/CDA1 family)